MSFNKGPASGAVPVCGCMGSRAQGANLLYVAAWCRLETGVSQRAFAGTGCMCARAACAHCTTFARTGKVSETQAIIALWWVSVKPSGGVHQFLCRILCQCACPTRFAWTTRSDRSSCRNEVRIMLHGVFSMHANRRWDLEQCCKVGSYLPVLGFSR